MIVCSFLFLFFHKKALISFDKFVKTKPAITGYFQASPSPHNNSTTVPELAVSSHRRSTNRVTGQINTINYRPYCYAMNTQLAQYTCCGMSLSGRCKDLIGGHLKAIWISIWTLNAGRKRLFRNQFNDWCTSCYN